MKKILLMVLATMAMLPMVAQTDSTQRRIDTMYFPLDMPTYYKNEWMGLHLYSDFYVGELWATQAFYDARRYDIPGDTLNLVGLAGVFRFTDESETTMIHDSLDVNSRPLEYLQLYQCRTDTIELVAQKPWKPSEPRFRIHVVVGQYGPTVDRKPGLYEVYFDRPVTVRDSFYVGATTYYDGVLTGVNGHLKWLELVKYDALPYYPKDSIVVRGRWLRAYNSSMDTNAWMFGKTLWEYMMFPIIDTTGMFPHDPDTSQGGDTTIVDTTVVDTTGINRLVDQFSRVYPNPATDNVLIISSVPMRSVDVYDPMGRCVLRRRVDGTAVQLDLKGIARGQCLVVINTPAGRTVKKVLLQ